MQKWISPFLGILGKTLFKYVKPLIRETCYRSFLQPQKLALVSRSPNMLDCKNLTKLKYFLKVVLMPIAIISMICCYVIIVHGKNR